MKKGEKVKPDKFHAQWHIKDFRPLDQPKSADDVQRVKEIKEKLLKMNPTQRALQIDAINRLIEGSSAIVNNKLPKRSKKKNGRGRPKGSCNKPKNKKKQNNANKTTDKEEEDEEEEEAEEDTPKRRKQTKQPTQTQAKREPSRFVLVENKRKTEDKQVEKNKRQKLHDQKHVNKKEKPQDAQNPPKKKLCPVKTAALLPPPTSTSKSDHHEPEDAPQWKEDLPFIICSTVAQVLNVDSEGHCVFRAISWCFGCGQGDHIKI
ncbi:hypothetical protein MJO29_016475 [Puccinia striiformis f. sp. tritici]|nr:hypothetical protein MJO29_016475 [Puccinia striiformis f. sp. tritici]